MGLEKSLTPDVYRNVNGPPQGRAAWASPDPEAFVSHLPVHQDGSCNGLQHYAALGRDALGGKNVNLTPSDRPQDVYSAVCDIVIKRVAKDAETGVAEAKIVNGKVNRKMLKQTVMTYVYGVKFIGARDQVAGYLAHATMDAMKDLFTSARAIMEWLAKCSSLIASRQCPTAWVTPILGLPVVQPYRRQTPHMVRTMRQQVLMADQHDLLPVHSQKQQSAFPPNFVHSLDATHMLLTAIACHGDGLTFSSVHDSFWTHAATVDIMARRLREQFVRLYSEDILGEFRRSIVIRFPHVQFPPVPSTGTLELKRVLDAPYFFA